MNLDDLARRAARSAQRSASSPDTELPSYESLEATGATRGRRRMLAASLAAALLLVGGVAAAASGGDDTPTYVGAQGAGDSYDDVVAPECPEVAVDADGIDRTEFSATTDCEPTGEKPPRPRDCRPPVKPRPTPEVETETEVETENEADSGAVDATVGGAHAADLAVRRLCPPRPPKPCRRADAGVARPEKCPPPKPCRPDDPTPNDQTNVRNDRCPPPPCLAPTTGDGSGEGCPPPPPPCADGSVTADGSCPPPPEPCDATTTDAAGTCPPPPCATTETNEILPGDDCPPPPPPEPCDGIDPATGVAAPEDCPWPPDPCEPAPMPGDRLSRPYECPPPPDPCDGVTTPLNEDCPLPEPCPLAYPGPDGSDRCPPPPDPCDGDVVIMLYPSPCPPPPDPCTNPDGTASNTCPPPPGDMAVVKGIVTAGPTCAVISSGGDPTCADKPIVATITFTMSRPDAEFLFERTVTSNADGLFLTELPVGDYTVTVHSEMAMSCEPTTVSVTGDTALRLSCDTGIR